MATTKQVRKLYSDEIELIFNPKARNRYLVNDLTNQATVYPVGVTTVLSKVLAKEALMLWPMYEAVKHLKDNWFEGCTEEEFAVILDDSTKAHTRKSDRGKDVGTVVHDWIEAYLRGGAVDPESLSGEARRACMAFSDWALSIEPKVLATEQIVYSREHGYAGTFDALLEIDGKIVLCDVKTSNASRTSPLGIYPEYFLQLGAYSLAYKEAAMGEGVDWVAPLVTDLMVINASKTGRLSTLRASELGLSVADCERSWLQVLGLYRFLEPLKNTLKEMQ